MTKPKRYKRYRMNDGTRVYAAANYSLAFTSLQVMNCGTFVAALFLRETHCRQPG